MLASKFLGAQLCVPALRWASLKYFKDIEVMTTNDKLSVAQAVKEDPKPATAALARRIPFPIKYEFLEPHHNMCQFC